MPNLTISVDTTHDADDEALFEQVLRMRKTIEFDADEIDSRVFVGSLRSTSRPEELKKRNVTHILNLSCRSNPALERSAAHLKLLTVNILDAVNQRIIEKFDLCIEFILAGLAVSDTSSVLVCCSRGISRSVTIGCAFLMKCRGLDYKAALRTIQARRSIAAPHFSFIGQLFVYEKVGYRSDVAEADFQQLSAEFSRNVTPQDLFTDKLAMSFSMERGAYCSDDDDAMLAPDAAAK